jgi:hypothetical protein
VLRTGDAEKGFEAEPFFVFGPKVLASRHEFKDPALESRMLTRRMVPGERAQHVPRNLPPEFDDEALGLRNKLLLFRLRHYGQVRLEPDLAVPEFDDRLNQILVPLLSVVQEPGARDCILAAARKLHERQTAARMDSLEGLVMGVLIDRHAAGESLRLKSIKEDTNQILADNGSDLSMSEKKVGAIVRALGFTPQRSTGKNRAYYVPWDDELAQRLAVRYGLNNRGRDSEAEEESRQGAMAEWPEVDPEGTNPVARGPHSEAQGTQLHLEGGSPC